METIALSACSAAFAVSPPRELVSAALKLLTCSMYWLALMPAVWYALFALASTVDAASPKSLLMPPESCSYDA